LILKRLILTNYRNYPSCAIQDFKKINLFLGINGSGKTNLLDAVYYSALGKSYFSSKDSNVIKWGESFFRVEAHIEKGEANAKIEHAIIPGKKKETKINGKAIQKLSELLGHFPAVAIAPKEVYTLLSTSQERRKACDRIISQFDKSYVAALILYNNLIKRRNQLLKDAKQKSDLDMNLLQVLDKQLDTPAETIYKTRTKFAADIRKEFLESYIKISNNQEQADLQYESSITKGKLSDQLKQSLETDFFKKRTTVGIHKDDYIFRINDKKLNTFASQGQLKSFIIAFKLSLFRILSNNSSHLPFLILDDIFDKIDSKRTSALLQLLSTGDYGQIFISDADTLRLPEIMKKNELDYFKVIIENGSIEKE